MGDDKMTGLRQKLEQMSTQQLADRIHAETEKEIPDDDVVLSALHVLEERNAGEPVELGAGGEAAWKKYKAKKAGSYGTGSSWRRVAVAASLAIVVCFLAATIPLQAGAENFWKVLANWTDSIFEYVNIGGAAKEPNEYVFTTDNPGLQQVYDTVVSELGVTDPVVAQWLPEGYELSEIKIDETPSKKCVHAILKNGAEEVAFMFDKMKQDVSPEYDKSALQVEEFEIKGITHNIFRNSNTINANWVRANLKCSIHMECQEDVLKKIIKSIYSMEGNT